MIGREFAGIYQSKKVSTVKLNICERSCRHNFLNMILVLLEKNVEKRNYMFSFYTLNIYNTQLQFFVFTMQNKINYTHTHTCVRIRTWSNCRHNPHKVEHLHSHLTGRTKQSNFHIKAVEHAHSILDCLRLQNIEKATCLGRTLTQT